jgi:hypothetical protein
MTQQLIFPDAFGMPELARDFAAIAVLDRTQRLELFVIRRPSTAPE